jgi:hypothetical protein
MKSFKTFWHRAGLMMAMVLLVCMGLPAALSANANIPRKEAGLQSFPVAASTTIYKGGLVCMDADGYIVEGTDAHAVRFVGIAYEGVDNSTGSDGDLNGRVYTTGTHQLPATSITQAMVGDMMYLVDDATVDDVAGVSHYIPVGVLVQYDSTTLGWVDIGQRGVAAGPFNLDISGTGYSLNLINVISSTAAGNTRGLRVNVTTSPSIAHGDLQCVHGYLTLGASATLNANAAVYALSAWTNIPDSTTVGSGALIAGLRVIIDPNNNDLSTIAGGGESAVIYGNVWASTGTLDHGIAIAVGAGSTIGNLLHLGGSGTVDRIIDLSELGADTDIHFLSMGLKDAQNRSVQVYFGDLGTRAAIRAAKGDLIGMGSLYVSTTGDIFIKVAGATADTDWEVVSHVAADAG